MLEFECPRNPQSTFLTQNRLPSDFSANNFAHSAWLSFPSVASRPATFPAQRQTCCVLPVDEGFLSMFPFQTAKEQFGACPRGWRTSFTEANISTPRSTSFAADEWKLNPTPGCHNASWSTCSVADEWKLHRKTGSTVFTSSSQLGLSRSALWQLRRLGAAHIPGGVNIKFLEDCVVSSVRI